MIPLRTLLPWRVRVWWSELWIRKNEFHWTLNMDVEALVSMSAKRRERYMNRLMNRRNIAHERGLERDLDYDP